MQLELLAPRQSQGERASYRVAISLVVFLSAAIAVIRLTGLPDLMDNEQQLQSSYVMDAIHNGHWIIQLDDSGDVASKPPLYTWLSAGATLLGSRITRLSLCLPSVLATTAVAVLILTAGRKHLGERAGMLAALIYLISYPTARQIGLGRMDGLTPLVCTCCALAGYRAWMRGQGWILYWCCVVLVTLAKAPALALPASAGLLAIFWEKPPLASSRRHILLEHLVGLLLFGLIAGGWLWAALRSLGQPAIDKLIHQELLGQTIHPNRGAFPGQLLYLPLTYLVSRFLPWIIFSTLALVRIARQPSTDPNRRRFERFLFCWLLGGLVIQGIATHQRADLIFPACVPAALLAGHEMARMTDSWPTAKLRRIALFVAVLFLALITVYYHVAVQSNRMVRATLAMHQFTDETLRLGGERQAPITFVDAPYALQFDLNTMRPCIKTPKSSWEVLDAPEADYDRAARLLKGSRPVYLAVMSMDYLKPLLGDTPVYDLVHIDLGPAYLREIHLLSNRPAIRPEPSMVLASGPLDIETDGPRWVSASGNRFELSGSGVVRFRNTLTLPVTVFLRFGSPGFVEQTIPSGGDAVEIAHRE